MVIMKEFPNNWQRVHDAPDEAFQDDLTWEAFEQIRLDSWDLLDSVCLVIREEHYDPRGKLYRITEKNYQRAAAAEKHLAKRATEEGAHKFLLVDNAQMLEMTSMDVQQEIADSEDETND